MKGKRNDGKNVNKNDKINKNEVKKTDEYLQILHNIIIFQTS